MVLLTVRSRKSLARAGDDNIGPPSLFKLQISKCHLTWRDFGRYLILANHNNNEGVPFVSTADQLTARSEQKERCNDTSNILVAVRATSAQKHDNYRAVYMR